MTAATDWGRRAAALYAADYARKYRAHDDEIGTVEAYVRFCRWLGEVGDRFDRDIDVLDLGCGTGRYFRALHRARSIVGIDASAAMLAEARTPLAPQEITATRIELVQGDILVDDLGASQFDLVYSVGVLAEHSPLNARIVAAVARALRPGGRFAFTTVHPESASIPRTLGRTIGRLIFPMTRGIARRRLHDRLTARGMYADESLIRELLDDTFEIESLERIVSEAHLHCMCTARLMRAGGPPCALSPHTKE